MHSNPDGQLTVLGIMFDEGEENSMLNQLNGFRPAGMGPYTGPVDYNKLITGRDEYYTYNGSLTTPQRADNSRLAPVLMQAGGYVSAPIAARVAKLLLGRHPLNHFRSIVTFRVEFERNPIIVDGRLVVALGHDGLSEGIPCIGR